MQILLKGKGNSTLPLNKVEDKEFPYSAEINLKQIYNINL